MEYKEINIIMCINIYYEQLEVRVENGLENASRETSRTIRDAIIDLRLYLHGPKSDTLLLLLATHQYVVN